MATAQVLSSAAKGLQSEQQKKAGEKEGESIEPKEFFWDQFLKYISTGILALTVLNVSVEFLRGGGVTCFTPSTRVDPNSPEEEVYEITRNQADYINNYCARSIPRTEYFPIYILVHGILLVAPHYIWSALFKGDFDSFFSIVKRLDRLRDNSTGQYDLKNFDRVTKLEIEYGGKRRWIFWSYIFKLLLQLAVCVGSSIFSSTYFLNFAFNFDCPEDLVIENETAIQPDHWPINTTVPCVFTSLRLLGLVRFGDHGLLTIAMILTFYGLLWCIRRHPKELGYQAITDFAFQSCLSPDSFVFPQAFPWRRLYSCFTRFPPKKGKRCCNKNCLNCRFFTECQLFSPRIQNDLEFMLMVLFRSDSSHGRVFKDIQVGKELKKQRDRDHQLLHLYINVQQELRKRGTSRIQPRCWDLTDFFKNAGFTPRRPAEREAFEYFRPYLGNTEWHNISGIRDRLYGFVQFCPKDMEGHPTTELAVDISFGSTSIGYSLVLARAFKRVISVDFHPYYRNENEVVRKKEYYTNYITATCPESVFAQSSDKLNEINRQILFEINKQRQRRDIAVDFIVVGPIAHESQKVTVNLLLEMMFTARQFGEGAILLAVRPLKIAHKVVKRRFDKYEPAQELFDHTYHRGDIYQKLQVEVGFHDVEGTPGIRVDCDDVPCIFEFVAYKFKGNPPQDGSCSKEGGGGEGNEPDAGNHSAATPHTQQEDEEGSEPDPEELIRLIGALPAPPDPTRHRRANPDQSENNARETAPNNSDPSNQTASPQNHSQLPTFDNNGHPLQIHPQGLTRRPCNVIGLPGNNSVDSAVQRNRFPPNPEQQHRVTVPNGAAHTSNDTHPPSAVHPSGSCAGTEV